MTSIGSHEDESLSELNKMNYFIEKRDCKEPLKDESELEMTPPLLPGEYLRFIGSSREGVLGLTNFRLLQSSETEGQFRVNIPIRMLEGVIGTELFVVMVHTKDAGAIRFSFSNNDMASTWRNRLTEALAPLPHLDSFFCFQFKAFLEDLEFRNFRRIFDGSGYEIEIETDRLKIGTVNGEGVGEEPKTVSWRRPDEYRALMDEFRRMGFDEQSWRVTTLNCGYRVCETYCEPHIVPLQFEDNNLREALDYRAAHRFPSVTWRSRRTGAVIARCSQPGTGFFSARNNHDEELLRCIVAAARANRPVCSQTVPLTNGSTPSSSASTVPDESQEPSMLIVDARSYSAAFANRARGYGTELADYYPSCRIEFGNLANIHAVRTAYDALRTAGLTTASNDFQLAVSSSRWLQYLAQLLHCTRLIIDSVEKGCPVLIHCSDGWDRTPQLTALAQVCLDPYYRTLAGFRTLVEREWLAFGHKFADRCGHDTTAHRTHASERSQVFVQWLDAIYQIVTQFPTAFEYNSYFLKKLAIHANSCMFGTFLLNTSKERADNSTIIQTCSVWDYLRPDSNWRVLNLLYHEKSAPEVLRPSSCTRDILVWRDLYSSHWPTADSGDLPSAEPSPVNYALRAATETAPLTVSTMAATEEEDARRLVRSRSEEALLSRRGVRGNGEERPDEGLVMTAASSELLLNDVSGMISSSDTVVLRPTVMHGSASPDQAPLQLHNGNQLGRSLTHCASGSSINNGMQRSYLGASCTSIEGLDHSTELFTNVERHLQRQARMLAAKNKDKQQQHASQRVNGLSPPPPNFVGLDWDGLPMPALSDGLVIRSLMLQYERQLAMERDKRADYRRRANEAEVQNQDLRNALVSLQEEVRRLQQQNDGRPAQLSSSPDNAIAPGFFDPNAQLPQPLALLPTDCMPPNDAILCRNNAGGHSETMSSVGSDYVRVNDHEEPQFWQPDHLATQCGYCKTDFHYLLRKHHCRKCGLVYCDSCTPYRLAVPEQQCYDPVRVCYNCYETMTATLGNSTAAGSIEKVHEVPATNGRSPSVPGRVSSASKCSEASAGQEAATNGQVRANTAYVMG